MKSCALAVLVLAVAGLMFISTPATAAAASVQDLQDEGVVKDGTRLDNTQDWLSGLNAIVIVTPGTDDTGLAERTAGLVGNRTTYIVQYPESIGPLISGKSGAFLPFLAPTYDESSEIAAANNLAVMRALHDNPPGKPAIYTGYSQGAEALGNAAERAHAEGLLDGNSIIMLISDPRSPWGAKAWIASMPVLPQLLGLVGASSNGARDPGATGNVNVTSAVIVGDPAANFQWVWYRPVSSLLVNAAGFLTIHSDPKYYGNLPSYGDPTYYRSKDGNTTYSVYRVGHPLALMRARVYDALGVKYTDEDLAKWNAQSEQFYKLQEPTPDNAAVPVEPLAPAVTTQKEAPSVVVNNGAPQDDAPMVSEEPVQPVVSSRPEVQLDVTEDQPDPQPEEVVTDDAPVEEPAAPVVTPEEAPTSQVEVGLAS